MDLAFRFDEEHSTDDASNSRGRAGKVAAPPLMPDPSLTTPKRPNKLWDLLPTKQLSPIPASPAGCENGDDSDSPTQQQGPNSIENIPT